jgi:hypothetical protein
MLSPQGVTPLTHSRPRRQRRHQRIVTTVASNVGSDRASTSASRVDVPGRLPCLRRRRHGRSEVPDIVEGGLPRRLLPAPPPLTPLHRRITAASLPPPPTRANTDAAACKAFDLTSVPRGTSPKGTTRWLAAHIGWPHARGDGHTSRKGGAERQLWQYSVDIPTIAPTRHYGVAGPRVRLPGSEAWPITAATRSELYQETARPTTDHRTTDHRPARTAHIEATSQDGSSAKTWAHAHHVPLSRPHLFAARPTWAFLRGHAALEEVRGAMAQRSHYCIMCAACAARRSKH